MIHQYKLNGHNIVIDVHSGSVHVVDDVAYDVISMYETSSKNEIIAKITEKYPDISENDVILCLGDIEALKENKQLFAEDIYEDKAELLKTYLK